MDLKNSRFATQAEFPERKTKTLDPRQVGDDRRGKAGGVRCRGYEDPITFTKTMDSRLKMSRMTDSGRRWLLFYPPLPGNGHVLSKTDSILLFYFVTPLFLKGRGIQTFRNRRLENS